MKKGKFLFAITGTIILLLQSILPAVAIDESEDLKNIKAELESMIPEEELGKYGKGEVIGEAYIDQEESYCEERNPEEAEEGIMLLSAVGSPAVITPGAGHSYGLVGDL